MKVKKVLLAFGEGSDVDYVLCCNSHSLQRRLVCNGRNDQFACIFESNESSIKEVIDAGGEEQSIFSIQSLFIRGIAPRL